MNSCGPVTTQLLYTTYLSVVWNISTSISAHASPMRYTVDENKVKFLLDKITKLRVLPTSPTNTTSE